MNVKNLLHSFLHPVLSVALLQDLRMRRGACNDTISNSKHYLLALMKSHQATDPWKVASLLSICLKKKKKASYKSNKLFLWCYYAIDKQKILKNWHVILSLFSPFKRELYLIYSKLQGKVAFMGISMVFHTIVWVT